MQVEFLSKFYKDLDYISQKSVKSNVTKLISLVESADNLHDIPNLKKQVRIQSSYR